MNKVNLFNEEYVAPEIEVVSTVVEAGFAVSLSVDISDAEEDNWGEF